MGHSVKGMTLWLCVAALVFVTAGLAACGGGGRGVVEEQNRFAGPTSMAVASNFLDPYGHYLFVANSQGGTISVINAHSYQVLSAHTNDVDDYDVIRVGRAPHRIALTPAGDRLFVTDAWEDSVRVVSGWAGRRPDIFDVKVVFDADGNKFLRYEIAVKELDTVVRAGEIAIPSYLDPDGLAVPVFVTDPDNNRVIVLDSETGEAYDEIPLPESPTNIAVTPTGNLVFVTGAEGRLYIIDGDDFTLLIDLTLQLRTQGVARRAAVEEAGIRRLRPILMTALTTIFGMLPVALKIGKGAEIRAPMAIAVIGGLALSTLLTLIIIPVTYTVLDDWFPASSDSGDSQPTSG